MVDYLRGELVAFLGIRCPHDIARIFSQIDVIGEKEPLGFQHITMGYMGDDVAIDQLAKACVAIFNVTSKFKPFTVQTSRVTTFPPHPEHGTVPIICPIVSEALHELQGKIMRSLDQAGVDYSKKFPIYKPHVTLSYLKDAEADVDKIADRDIPLIEWGVAEVVLWGGDEGDQRFSASFPLSIGNTASSKEHPLYLALVRMLLASKKASEPSRIAHDENGFCAPTCSCHTDEMAHKVVARFLGR